MCVWPGSVARLPQLHCTQPGQLACTSRAGDLIFLGRAARMHSCLLPWSPSFCSNPHTGLEIPSTLPSKSYVAVLGLPLEHLASPTQGLQCTSEILAGHTCTILALPYQQHSSGSSNSLWPESFSVPVIFFMV